MPPISPLSQRAYERSIKRGDFELTPRQRVVASLELRQLDMDPIFELEFQLEEEMFGRAFAPQKDSDGLSTGQLEYRLKANAE